jgi:hypothetical protein
MGVTVRKVTGDFNPSAAGEIGEMIVNKGDVLIKLADGYVSVRKLRDTLALVAGIALSDDLKEILLGYAKSKKVVRDLGIVDTTTFQF